ncbi:MAG: hypothetical protein U0353_13585 [Sandaracinus sp.]
MSPLVRLRTLVATWRTAAFERVLARWSGADDELRREARARAALGTGEARALLDECVSLRLVDDVDHRAILAHLADAARDELCVRRSVPGALARSHSVELGGEPISLGDVAHDASRWTERERLRVVARTVSERASRWAEGHAEADAAASRVLARGPKEAEGERLAIDLEAWLAATDDAVHEALSRTTHALALGAARGPAVDRHATTARALRASSLDALFGRDGRMTRLGRAFEPMGADAVVAARLRVAVRTELALRGAVLPLETPRRVVLGLASEELGLVSELESAELFGRGLSYARVSPALADEHRLAPHAPVPAMVGALFSVFYTAPVFLERRVGLERAAASAVGVCATYLWLVRARLDLARARARRVGLSVDSDEAHALVARCLALPSALPLGWLLASDEITPALEATALAQASAPALFLALRERHDEDFFRNPRTSDTLGGAMARGARLSARGWSEELGATAETHAAAASLFRERLA